VLCRPLEAQYVPVQRSVDDCFRVVHALDKAFTDALTPLLPPGAVIENNTSSEAGPFGGPGVHFYRGVGEHKDERFEVSVRIRDGGIPYNLRVQLEKYDHVPHEDWCTPAPGMSDDRASKGIVSVECTQAEVPGGTVFRSVTTYPYGSGEYAKLRYPTAAVALHRTGGEVVTIGYDTVIEKVPTTPITPATLPMKITMDQLVALASRPDLTIG